jgi:hypothetical protein
MVHVAAQSLPTLHVAAQSLPTLHVAAQSCSKQCMGHSTSYGQQDMRYLYFIWPIVHVDALHHLPRVHVAAQPSGQQCMCLLNITWPTAHVGAQTSGQQCMWPLYSIWITVHEATLYYLGNCASSYIMGRQWLYCPLARLCLHSIYLYIWLLGGNFGPRARMTSRCSHLWLSHNQSFPPYHQQ